MLKKIQEFMIIAANSILAAAFYRISAMVYSWYYSYPSPIAAPFAYILPEIRPIIGLYWSLPPSEILAYSLFIVIHTAEALLIFFTAAITLKYIFCQQIQITKQSSIKGICLFFGATLAHVFLNGATIYTLLQYVDYVGPLVNDYPLSIIVSIIFSIFLIPLAYLFLIMNFFAAIILMRPAISLKNAYIRIPSFATWWQCSNSR